MRCDYETDNGVCNAAAKWEFVIGRYLTVHACDRHSLAMAVAAKTAPQPVRDGEEQARFEHYRDEAEFERNYTSEA